MHGGDVKCVACGETCADKRALSRHVRRSHGISTREYTVKYLCGGDAPTCLACGEETRYVAFTFKKYCAKHARMAEIAGGARGGRAPAWNRGLTKRDDARIAEIARKLSGAGNPFYGRRHSEETLRKLRAARRLTREEYEARTASRANELIVVTPYDEYERRQGQYLDVTCASCGHEMKRTLETFERGAACPKCAPATSSKGEREVAEFIESLDVGGVRRNVRDVIPPKELDIFVPERSFAVEFNGLYVHMDGGHFDAVDPHAHRNKTRACERIGVRLFHIFDDEWREKRALVERMIAHRLGVFGRVIRASKCAVERLEPRDARTFYEENHIAGFAPASSHLALVERGTGLVVAAMSFRAPRQARRYAGHVEVARFAIAPGVHVLGAAGKLFKAFRASDDARGRVGALAYADLRFGTGAVYERIGFRPAGDTAVDYWLTDGRTRYDRFKFRARDGASGREIEARAGVYRVYGCGSRRYVATL